MKNPKYYLLIAFNLIICAQFIAINMDSLYQIIDTTKNIQLKIDAYNKLGWELRFSDNAKSKAYLQQSFQLLQMNQYPKGRAQALNNYGCNIMLTGQFKEAEDSLNKAVDIYKSLGLNEEVGKSLTNIGTIYYSQGKVVEAITYCEQAMTYFNDFPEKAAKTNVNMGVMYRTIGNYEKAIEKQLLALEYFKEVGDTLSLLTSLNNIGSLYMHFKQYDKAIDYHEIALNLSSNFPADKARSFGGLGSAYHKLKMNDKAYSFFSKSLNLFKDLDLKKEIASTTYNIADVLLDKKKYNEALQNVYDSKQHFTVLNLERERVTSINLIGLIYFELQQNDSALLYLQKALDLQKNINDPIIYQSTLRNLAKLYEINGDTSKANKLYHLYNESKDSIFSIIAAEKVAESEAKFRLKEKDKEIEKTKIENESLTDKLKSYSWLIAILFCLVIVIVFIYLRKRKESSFIKTQKEEILKKYSSLEEAYINMYNALEQFQQKGTSKLSNHKTLPEWVSDLSKRELEVLSCLAVGMTDQEISEKLFVSLATVRTHCRRIYSKLLVKNRSEAANFAREHGLIL